MELLWLGVSVVLGAAGHVLAKLGVSRAPGLLPALLQPLVWLAVLSYGLSFVAWLGFLRARPVSAAVPCAGLTYVLVVLAGVFFLGERLTPARLAGSCLVVAGVWLLAR